MKAADSIITCHTVGLWLYSVLVDEHAKRTYVAAILRLVGINNSTRHDHKGLIICETRVLLSPFAILKCCPCSTVLDLHDSGLSITSSLWEECYRGAVAECFNSTTEEGLTIVTLADHWYIPRAEKNFTQYGIPIKARWIGQLECCHGRNGGRTFTPIVQYTHMRKRRGCMVSIIRAIKAMITKREDAQSTAGSNIILW